MVSGYSCFLNCLADMLGNVGRPITDDALFIKALHVMDPKFSLLAVGILTTKDPPLTFLYS